MNEGKKRCCGCDCGGGCGGPKKEDRADLDTADLERLFSDRPDGVSTTKGAAEKARIAAEAEGAA